MAILDTHHPWAFAFGLLGNIISFLVFLAPVPTFYRICKKKSTEGFQSLPYLVALFSSTLWLYYAFLKTDVVLLITINTFGCFIETIYITLYITYASKQAKIMTIKLFLSMNVAIFSLIVIFSHFLLNGLTRVEVLGWINVAVSVCVFAAPLSIIAQVIRTKSVEFMPFNLSFFLTLSAVMWFAYGTLKHDICVAIPNVLGFLFGVLQMALYGYYRNRNTKVVEEKKISEQTKGVVTLGTILESADYQKHDVIIDMKEDVILKNDNEKTEEISDEKNLEASDGHKPDDEA